MLITKELIKTEINNIDDELLPVLYKIIKALEMPDSIQTDEESKWQNFIEETYGCLSDEPIRSRAKTIDDIFGKLHKPGRKAVSVEEMNAAIKKN
ncbi:hypothetical protein GMMP15_1290002 [Candidatus Magnetomoraceae bacterium gMMP-15]